MALPEVGRWREVETHAGEVNGGIGEQEEARGDLSDGIQATDEEAELDKETRHQNCNNWVVLVGASGDEVKEESKEIVLSDGTDQPARPDQVAQGGGPGGEDDTDQDKAAPECELCHVEAVVEEECWWARERGEKSKKEKGGEGESTSW